jgi:hypothetical protein
MTSYFVLYVAIAIWVFFNAKKRKYNGLPWAAFTAILGPLVVPFYLAKRPLKAGEVREGGTGWNVLKYFALFWTVTVGVLFVVGMANASQVVDNAGDQYAKAGAGIGMALGGAMIFGLWLTVLVAALVLGFFLKKSSVVERGPTGPLAAEVKP